MSELNQNWCVNVHKRNHNEINQLITGSVGFVQSFVIANWGKQNRLTLNEIVHFKTNYNHTNLTEITYVDQFKLLQIKIKQSSIYDTNPTHKIDRTN
jgi:hypothetical protein